jgi:predicted RNA binding protein YcfA (HicA-like mRNA interferase family)
MKKREFLRHIKENGCKSFLKGNTHTVYMNMHTGKKVTVPHHRELHKDFYEVICKQLQIPFVNL